MEKRIFTIFAGMLILFLFLGLTVQYAEASCAVSTPEENYERSDFVVRGTAMEKRESIFGKEHYEFYVDTYFKGEGPAQLKVSGKIDSASESSVDFEIEEGRRYLLFLRGEKNKILKTDVCSGSKEVAGPLSSKEIRVMGSGKAPIYEDSPQYLTDAKAMITITLIVFAGVIGSIFMLKKELSNRREIEKNFDY